MGGQYEIDFKEILWALMDWIKLAKGERCDDLKTEMNIRVL
jgi:hypothetical protein